MLRKKNNTVENPVANAGTVSPIGSSEVDTSLIEYNLSLSFEERLAQHQSALNLLIELQIAGEHFRAREDEARSQ